MHWADIYAEQVIREKGDKESYTCASGITPSGTVHIGNFREIISTELVARALRDRGKKARFIFSWDDFDVFRKVPDNMVNRDKLIPYLRQPISHIPDVNGTAASYAAANEQEIERELGRVGIHPEFIYQHREFASGRYGAAMKQALRQADVIREILDQYRQQPLPPDWLPLRLFCRNCHRDTTTLSIEEPVSGERVFYKCDSCGRGESVDPADYPWGKLSWRVDWPMRWQAEGVDLEPAGKDHHSEGGSFDTGRQIAERVFGGRAPVSFRYDFVRIKGRGGKISSSGGEVLSLGDVLQVYQPQVVRYLFAGSRPNSEFAISFDLDVLKIYEDYDRCERLYYSRPEGKKKQKEREKISRVYELSQIDSVGPAMPYQIAMRHFCNLLQIYDGDCQKVFDFLADVPAADEPRLRLRAECARNWLENFAPPEFRFRLRRPDEGAVVGLSGGQKELAAELARIFIDTDVLWQEKALESLFFEIAGRFDQPPKKLFELFYMILLGRGDGPRLANFLLAIGRPRLKAILRNYCSDAV